MKSLKDTRLIAFLIITLFIVVLWIGISLPSRIELIKWARKYDGPKPASVELVSSYDVSEDETSTLTEKEISLPEIGENWTVQLPKDTTLEMVYIPPGTFEMGNPVNNGDKLFDEKQHKVTLTKGFWIGKYEVTQKQWKSILRLEKKQCNGYGDDCPVHRVNWYEANEFCRRLNQREIKAGRLPRNYRYVLPTEAQWEYACRAGTTTSLNNGKDFTGVYKERFHGFGETLAELGFSFGNGKWTDCPNLDEVAWCSNNSNNRVHPVGQKKPNAWGLYDMHGNISEWCVDKYIAKYPRETVDPIGSYPIRKSLLYDSNARILRGGCFSSSGCSQSQRHMNDSAVGFSYIGFRLALVYFDREEDIKPENLQVRFAGVADLEPIYDDEGNLKPKYKQPEQNPSQN